MGKSVRYLARGSRAIAEFFGPGKKPVLNSLAQKRAFVCMRCPLNKPAKGWIKTLDAGAAKATREYFRIKDSLNLKVEGEESLGICDACWCPLKIKIHMPLSHILEHTDEETLAEFHDACWVTEEMNLIPQ